MNSDNGVGPVDARPGEQISWPRVSAAPAQRTTDAVYSSMQLVEFPGGRTGVFASQAPFPAGAPMDFNESLLDQPPAISVGGTMVHYLVLATWQPVPQAPPVMMGPPAPAVAGTFAGRGAGIGAAVGAAIGLVLAVILMSNAYQNAADQMSFGEPEINPGKALVLLILSVGCTGAAGAVVGAIAGATRPRRR